MIRECGHQVSVMAASGVVAFLMSNASYFTDPVKYPATCLSSPFSVILLSLFIGYVIGSIFFSVSPVYNYVILITSNVLLFIPAR